MCHVVFKVPSAGLRLEIKNDFLCTCLFSVKHLAAPCSRCSGLLVVAGSVTAGFWRSGAGWSQGQGSICSISPGWINAAHLFALSTH